MIELLPWDSQLLGRKLGRIAQKPCAIADVAAAVEKARQEGFQHLMRRLHHDEFHTVRWFEQSGFCIVDIGVVWRCESTLDIANADASQATVAVESQIPSLQRAMHRIWNDSRFYQDPFFTERDADLIFAEWVKNSVTGQAANAAFTIGNVSLITCKKLADGRGDIPLVGVHPSHQGKGLGRHLVARALQWFRDNGCSTVTVRTQLRNVSALNFYRALGFGVGWADLTVSKIL
jgi:GNAT superfamily N-acetyltransferase